MIQVGTKLKSIRTGEVVEVLELASGQKKVRKADGTEKYLSDCNIARWYDEVIEQAAPQAAEKVVKSAPVKEKKQPAMSKQVEPKKAVKKEVPEQVKIFSELYGNFKTVVKEKYGLGLYSMKEYSGVRDGQRCLCHFFPLRKKLRFAFKPSDLTKEDMNWLLKYPVHFRRAYCYYIEVKDGAQLDKVLKLIERIKQEKK